MSGVAWGLVAVMSVVAGVDWHAVATGNKRLEYVAKPAVMLPLLALAATMEVAAPAMRGWFVAAVVFGLFGDVFLMFERDELFVFGLGSFLVGHIAYIVGLARGGTTAGWVIVGAVLTFTTVAAVGPTIVKGAADRDRRLGAPVALYIAVIGVMVTLAVGSGVGVAVAGALLFFASDFAIGWSRFVQPFASARMVIIVTYHVGQLLLVTSMAIAR